MLESEGKAMDGFKPYARNGQDRRLAVVLFLLSATLALVLGARGRKWIRPFALARMGERGQSLVEFALSLPVLLVLLMGVMDFGRAFYFQNTISNMAREGARYASMYARPNGDEYGHELPSIPAVIAHTRSFDNGMTVIVTVAYDGDMDDSNREDPDENDDDDNDGQRDHSDDDDDGDGVDDEHDCDRDSDHDGHSDYEDDDDGDFHDTEDSGGDWEYRQLSGIRVVVRVQTTFVPITPFVPRTFNLASKAVMVTE